MKKRGRGGEGFGDAREKKVRIVEISTAHFR